MNEKPTVLLNTIVATRTIPSPFFLRWSNYFIDWASGKEDDTIQLLKPHVLYRHSYLPMARRTVCEFFLKQTKADYLVMIDCDEVWPINAISRLVSYDLPIVSGIYYSVFPPYTPVIRQFIPEQGLSVGLQELPVNSLLEVDAVGAGALCIRRDVFEKVSPESFLPLPADQCEWGSVSEDFAFCYACKQAGYKIVVDTGCEFGHLTDLTVNSETFSKYMQENPPENKKEE